VDQDHRSVGGEDRDCEREPERRHTQQDQQRSHLRRRLALAWEVQIPALAVALVAVGEPLDE
jgi:hypothetical protein